MEKELNLCVLATSLHEPGMDWLGLRRIRTRTGYLSARNGKPEVGHHEWSDGLMVEVRAKGHIGYCATNGLSEVEVRDAMRRALRVARAAAPHAIFRFDDTVRPAVRGVYRSARREDFGSGFHGGHVDLLVSLTEDLRASDRVVKAAATFVLRDLTIEYASSSGADFRQEMLVAGCDLRAIAQADGKVQQRTHHGYLTHLFQSGPDLFHAESLRREARRIGAEALELLAAEDCPTDTRDVVLAPDQMILQIHESIGHPLELDRILGDERNYAGSSFVRLEDIGSLQYGSPLLNVSFDPSVETEVASYGFDDLGNPASKQAIIRNGMLVRALGSLESQARAGVPGVANARVCAWNRPPIDRMANLNLEPGSSSFDAIIGSIERGVFMATNRSWSIDDFRNKFQFGCEYGRLIENGRLARLVRNPNYRGISVPFWRSLKAVGDTSTFQVLGVSNCGKGEPNQAVWVGHASPVCAFSNVEVFGGAS